MAADQPPAPPPLRIFINYRRRDSSGYTLGLHEHLEERFGDGNVFMDLDVIRPGSDFAEVISKALEGCHVLLAVIGRNWLNCSDAQGCRRLDDPGDFVRMELEGALGRGIRVIPLLVQGASMPTHADLPPSLAPLARLQALELSDQRWRTDVARLIGELEQLEELSDPQHTLIADHSSSPVHNLPTELDSFVGREAELAEVRRILSRSRLLTLLGTGGIGKTRLAVQVAATLLSEHPDGVWFVDLSPRDVDTGVAAEVAETIGVKEAPGRPITEAIVGHLRSRNALVVLDNCEHLVSACAVLAETVLRACPDVRILATSREPLRVRGETVWHVPPLDVPEEGPATDVIRSGAAQLFLDRATAFNPEYTLDAVGAAALYRLCRRLDGLPLAIELAAARTRALSVSEIAARLDDRFRLLDSGPRTAPGRHQALRATLDWTYDGLSPDEKRLFGRLAVFSGGFTLTAAETVCSLSDLSAGDISGLVFLLVDKSLLLAQPRVAGGTRYQMLETIAAYSAERLGETDEEAALRDRHLDCFSALAERVEATLRVPHRAPRSDELAGELDVLEEDHDNLRRALGWAYSAGHVERGLRLAGALAGFWFIRHHCTEGRSWLEQGLGWWERGDASVRAKALVALAAMEWMLGDYRHAVPALEEALRLYGALDDRLGVAESLNFLGSIAAQRGDVDRARVLLTEALDAWHGTDAKRTAFESLDGLMANLGSLSLHEGEYGEARRRFQEALAVAQELGDELRVAEHLFELGRTASAEDDHAAAEALFDQALPVARRLGYTRLVLALLVSRAKSARVQGELGEASMLLQEGLTQASSVGDRLAVLRCLEEAGAVAAAMGEGEHAAVLTGASDAIRDDLAMGLTVWESHHRERMLGESKAEIGSDRVQAALERGRAMSLEQAVAASEDFFAGGERRAVRG